MRVSLLAVATGPVLATVAFAVAAAAQTTPTDLPIVHFADDSKLEVQFESKATTTKMVIVVANGGPAANATLTALVPEKNTVPATPILGVTVDGAAADGSFTLPEQRVTPLTVTFQRPSDKRSLSGWLVLQGVGFAPSVRDMSTTVADWPYELGPFSGVIDTGSLPIGPATIPVIAIFTALVVVLLAVLRLTWKASVGRAKWSLSDSWASTLTAAGAVLGTAVGTTLLPDHPVILGKQTYITLNLLFGFLVLLAPLLFESLRGASGTAKTWTFVLAATITLAAVLGELMTLVFFTMDIDPAVASNTLRGIFILSGLIGVAAAILYAWRKVRAIAGAPSETNTKALPIAEIATEWTLL